MSKPFSRDEWAKRAKAAQAPTKADTTAEESKKDPEKEGEDMDESEH